MRRRGRSISSGKPAAGESTTNSSTGTPRLEHNRPSTGVSFLKSPFRNRVTRERSIFAALAISAARLDPAAIFNRRASFSKFTR